jgi:GABA permease
VLVLANQTVGSEELRDELHRIGADRSATYFVVVPASPIETGTAATHGPLDVAEATREIAQQRLEDTLFTLRSENLDADGTLGDYRPLRALSTAVDSFHPADRNLDAAARRVGVAPLRRRGPRPGRAQNPGDARRVPGTD